jgi:nucleoside-diphosphate-sugar epimerase
MSRGGPLAGAGVGTYNVCAEPCTVRELVEEIASALKRRLPRWRIPAAGVRH